MESLHIHVIPVSGGGFAPQSGLVLDWSEARRRCRLPVSPNLCLAASGGNVAAYMTMASQYSFEGLSRICEKLDSGIFVSSWWPDKLSFLPSALIGLFNGSLYRPGYGAGLLFDSIFTPSSVQYTEIWTGTFNKSSRRAQLFCNRGFETSILRTNILDSQRSIFSCDSPVYLDGNLDLISKATIASASIPMLVEEQTFLGNAYMDGGTMYASSLAPLSEEIYEVVMGTNVDDKKYYIIDKFDTESVVYKGGQLDPLVELTPSPVKPRKLEMLYIASYNMDTYFPSGFHGYGGEIGSTLATLLHAGTVVDRNAALALFNRVAGDSQVEYSNIRSINLDSLTKIVESLKYSQHYFVCLYPHGDPSVDMSSFVGADVVRVATETTKSYGAHVWKC